MKTWEQRQLKDVATLSSSKRIHLSDYSESGIPFYRGSEISSGTFNVSKQLYISKDLYKNIMQKYGVPKAGDILVTAVGTLGNVWKVDNREFYYKDGNLILISKIKIDTDYLFSYLSEDIGKNAMLGNAAGSNQKALTMVKLCEIVISYPSAKEQTRIAYLTSVLASLIAANEYNDEFTIEVQQMIKKKTHSLSPCKI
ncbi:restriction endonuclease subunit S [Lactiplantibacillus argentoratensis]|uniref:restriction endonuclease subunit S n=1 Tax=Lactiplantibacillus argentoratensis TaxID=271881 RepID=UPI003D2CE62A